MQLSNKTFFRLCRSLVTKTPMFGETGECILELKKASHLIVSLSADLTMRLTIPNVLFFTEELTAKHCMVGPGPRDRTLKRSAPRALRSALVPLRGIVHANL
jgi:hypothetical protein